MPDPANHPALDSQTGSARPGAKSPVSIYILSVISTLVVICFLLGLLALSRLFSPTVPTTQPEPVPSPFTPIGEGESRGYTGSGTKLYASKLVVDGRTYIIVESYRGLTMVELK